MMGKVDSLQLMTVVALNQSTKEECEKTVHSYMLHSVFGIHSDCNINFNGSPGMPDCFIKTDEWNAMNVRLHNL